MKKKIFIITLSIILIFLAIPKEITYTVKEERHNIEFNIKVKKNYQWFSNYYDIDVDINNKSIYTLDFLHEGIDNTAQIEVENGGVIKFRLINGVMQVIDPTKTISSGWEENATLPSNQSAGQKALYKIKRTSSKKPNVYYAFYYNVYKENDQYEQNKIRIPLP